MNPTSVQAQPPNVKREIISRNPATLVELGRVPILGDEDVQRAVVKAQAAQPSWAALSFAERGRIILRAKKILVTQQEEYCELISRETGKPPVEALASEVLPVANLMDYLV